MTKAVVRAAIFARKSSDDGPAQELSSLDAQHGAYVACIASQRHEGWKLVPTRYDDGGVSGGTLDRPGLRRLMADIDAGRIDMVGESCSSNRVEGRLLQQPGTSSPPIG